MGPGSTQEDTLVDLCGQWLLPASLSCSLGTLREVCLCGCHLARGSTHGLKLHFDLLGCFKLGAASLICVRSLSAGYAAQAGAHS